MRLLGPQDAAAVERLAARAYPGTFHLSQQDLHDTLADLPQGDNYCLGLFDQGQLRAYLMCWVDQSQVEERAEEAVLLLDDIVAQGMDLYRLLRALRRTIDERGHTRLAIEGTHREQAEALFRAHPKVLQRLGFRQAATHHYFGEREQEMLCWARYEPLE